jgi:tripartite-type tricarboxylate transporter receptor subunit TctC
VQKVSAEVQRIVRLPHVQERVLSIGAKPVGNTPEEFAQFINAETQKWAEVVKAAGISIE